MIIGYAALILRYLLLPASGVLVTLGLGITLDGHTLSIDLDSLATTLAGFATFAVTFAWGRIAKAKGGKT